MNLSGLSERLSASWQNLTSTKETPSTNKASETKPAPQSALHFTTMSERLNYLAQQFDAKSLPIDQVLPLQSALRDSGLIQSNQVRAQGLITQMAYQHQQAGPMNLEQALESHLTKLGEKPAVLADYQEGEHVLNVVRNLISARAQQTHAA